MYSLWEQAAAQGISAGRLRSSDSGSAGCDNFDTQQQAELGLQVNGLSSTPFNISVGGTDYDPLATDFTKYALTTNRSNYSSALGYIPELLMERFHGDKWSVKRKYTTHVRMAETKILLPAAAESPAASPQTSTRRAISSDCGAAYATGDPYRLGQTVVADASGALNIPADGVRDLPGHFLAGRGWSLWRRIGSFARMMSTPTEIRITVPG